MADANNIVLLLPQVLKRLIIIYLLTEFVYILIVVHSIALLQIKTERHNNGCWNWWGYLNDSADTIFATRNAVQMRAIFAMIDRMAKVDQN